MLTLRSTEQIKQDILSQGKALSTFPQSVDFPFALSYTDLVKEIRTREISSECTLFAAAEAWKETSAFADPGYWPETYTRQDIDRFWIFGQNGQGDLWLFDREHKLYFYDHNQAQMGLHNFVELHIDFDSWLQYADLNSQLDEIYYREGEINEACKDDYTRKLQHMGSALLQLFEL
ncbi:hypothetical protein U0038_11265 [Sphingobacterium spiritivorum]|uniref:Knr4/Smi1-like domain-containing protein n=2 Tax=Sphingobacterium spiritivorum TaxID=258 RepID=D7VRY4_SPHSI|nr:hypothetical protein [Sphingobacterium spiritivorum]EFK56535.1 hypothetical protein HMPREF0766_13738 [Sphingobacterium spiritivorum ATCC 33861]QQT35401.1 hypothetical protein I6J01_19315 [Sphingobacterium spiritivorum]WQD32087.1 hypothetical protein U0038_11265 [Sphingobacterium spiritivorum]SUJ05656.1 Uncharacterised protein [Sphingobacterium spiritivorum]